MSDLVGNPEDRFSHNEAQIIQVDAGRATETSTVDWERKRLNRLRSQSTVLVSVILSPTTEFVEGFPRLKTH